MIEPIGKLTLARQRAVPLARVIGDAANLPLRQFQIDQRKRCIRPGCRANESFEPDDLLGLTCRRKASARLADHLRQELWGHGMNAAESIIELFGITMF